MLMKIKPKEGVRVPKPESKRDLAAEGEMVEQSSYWIRRIDEGDVILMDDDKMEMKQEPLKPAKAKKSENEGGLK